MDDETPARSLSEPHKALLGYLCEQANDPNIRIFAVMDGAFFQNVDADLRNAGLSRRPLYRYGGDYSVVMGGPWMVDPYHHDRDIQEEIVASARAAANGQPVADITPDSLSTIRQRLEAIFQVASGKPGLVFWIGNASLTPEAFYKHLRRLNKVLIPREKGQTGEAEGAISRAAATEEEATAPPEGGQAYELVIFRHADANVMAQVLPALDHGQCARLLGPYHEILYAPDEEWGGRAKRLKRAEGSMAEPPPGPLRWTPQTISAIKTLRLEGSVNQITAYLRKVAPDRVRDKSDAEMSALVKQSVHTGTELGIRSMAAHCRWAYLSLVTNGTLPKAPAVREFMTMEDTKFSPDERVRMLMQGTISSFKTKAGSP